MNDNKRRITNNKEGDSLRESLNALRQNDDRKAKKVQRIKKRIKSKGKFKNIFLNILKGVMGRGRGYKTFSLQLKMYQ